MDELWSKAQTRNEIIERSGTQFNSGLDMDLAMRDAETRLQTGGGLLGKGGLSLSGIINNDKGNMSDEIKSLYEKMVTRSLFGNINASRNSA